MHRTLLAVIAATVLTGACGTTVPVQSQARLSGTDGGLSADTQDGSRDGTSGAVSTAPVAAGSTGTAPSSNGGGSIGTSLGSSATGTVGTGSAGSTREGSVRPVSASLSSPGVSATTVNVGFHLAENAGAANAAIGGAGITRGDERSEIAVLIDDINKRGGIAGRKAVPVIFTYDANDTRSTEAIGAQACEYLTRDHKVFVVNGYLSDNELACLDKAGVWVLANQLKALNDRDVYKAHPDYYELGSPNLDRDFAQWVPTMSRQDYFRPWNTSTGQPAAAGTSKVGLLTVEYPSFRKAVTRTLLPALKAKGYEPTTYYLPFPASNADLGSFSSAVSSAVLKFRSAGVDHVLITDAGGLITLLFSNQAESQHYRPRYGSDSNAGWQALVDAKDIQKAQINGAVGVGFSPSLDLTPSDNADDGPYSNAARRDCLALYAKHGITFSDPNAKGLGIINCGVIRSMKTIGDRVKGPLTRAGVRVAVESLGTTFRTPDGLGDQLGPGKHDALSGYYDWVWQPTKGRMGYVGSLQHF